MEGQVLSDAWTWMLPLSLRACKHDLTPLSLSFLISRGRGQLQELSGSLEDKITWEHCGLGTQGSHSRGGAVPRVGGESQGAQGQSCPLLISHRPPALRPSH